MSIYDQCRPVPLNVELTRCPYTTSIMRILLLAVLVALSLQTPVRGALPPLEQLTPQNLHRLEQVGLIQRGTVEEIAWSPDESRIAVVGSAGVRIYEVWSGQERLLLGHLGGVNDVDFSPDGSQLVSAGDDGALRFWDAHTGTQLRALNPYADRECVCTYRLTAAKYTADGAFLWIGAENGPLRTINAQTGARISEDPRSVLEIFPDASRTRVAVIEPRSPRLSVWPSAGEFAPLRELDLRFTIWNAAFVPATSRLLVAGFVGAELTLIDSNTSETVAMLRGSRVLHVGNAGSVATQVIDWIGDLRRISLRITDVESGALQFNTPIPVELTDARFSPSGEYLAVSDIRGALTVWDWRRNLKLLDIAPRGTALIGLALLESGLVASIDSGIGVVQTLTRTVVEAGDTVRLWDLSSGREVGAFHPADFGLASVDTLYWDDRIDRLIVGSTADPTIQIEHDPATGEIRVVDSYNVALLADEQYMDEDPAGLLHAEALSNDDVRVSESAAESNAVTLRAAGPGLRFSSGGTLLLTTGPSGAIWLWGVRSASPAAD